VQVTTARIDGDGTGDYEKVKVTKRIVGSVMTPAEKAVIEAAVKGMIVIHIGKKAPKGWVELPGAKHLGHGIWMMRIERRKGK